MRRPRLSAVWLLSLIAAVGGACGDSSSPGTGGTSSSTTASSASGSSTNVTASASNGSSSDASSSSASSSDASSSGATGTSSASSSASTGGAGGATSSSSTGGGGGPTGTRVRVAAANLTSGSAQSYDSGEGIRILTGIHADVILLQEFNEGTNSNADLFSVVDSVCGMDCSYVRGPAAMIPNGVITSYPILSSGSWTDVLVSNRNFVWAQIDVPGPKDLWAISVHLLTTNATDRSNEASAIVANITASIPATDYVVLGGDFNTHTRVEPALTMLDPVFAIDGPYPADQNGNDFTSAPRTKPFDWVLANDALDAREIPALVGTTTFGSGAVIDTRIYTPLSDIAPALMGDSGALNMQHMAVVKDFALE